VGERVGILIVHPSIHYHPPSFPTTHTQPPRHDDSGTVIGLKCKDGLLLAVENLRLSKLLVPFSNRRTFPVGDHACIAVAGACGHLCMWVWNGCAHPFFVGYVSMDSTKGTGALDAPPPTPLTPPRWTDRAERTELTPPTTTTTTTTNPAKTTTRDF